MAKVRVLVDTDVLIKAFRSDLKAQEDLEKIGQGNIFISDVTALEFLAGARSISRVKEVNKQLKAYGIIHSDKYISKRAITLMKEYVSKYPIYPADCIIAATSLESGFPLLTYNKKHFDFIKGLKSYK